MDDSVITCDEIIEETVSANVNDKNAIYKTQSFFILLAFSLTTIALLIAVNIYCYLIKYRTKNRHLLPFHDKNKELKQVLY